MFALTRGGWSELRTYDPVWKGPLYRGSIFLLLPVALFLDLLVLPIGLLGLAIERFLVRWPAKG